MTTAIDYHERLLKIAKVVGDKASEGSAYSNIGIAYISLGEFKTAVEYLESHLKIAKEVGDRAGEGRGCKYLGFAHSGLRDFKTAVEYIERSLKIAKEVGDKAEEARAYFNFGKAYHLQGDFKAAIEYHERLLKVVNEVGDRAGERIAFQQLGLAYQKLGDLKTALDCHERCLKVAREVADKAGERTANCNLGDCCQCLGDFQTAIDYYECCLNICKEAEDRDGEKMAYNRLGTAYRCLGDFKTAIDYSQHALKIAKEVADKVGEGIAYGNFGNIYQSLGDSQTAINYYKRCLNICKEVENRAGEATAYCGLGNAYQSLGDLGRAIEYHGLYLKIAKEERDKVSEGAAYANLGNSYRTVGYLETAIEYHECQLEIAKEVGDRPGEGKGYANLGTCHRCLRDFKTATEYHERSLKIAKEVRDKHGESLAYSELGINFYALGDLKTATDCYKSSLKIAKEIGNRAMEGGSYNNLGSVYLCLGDLKTAIDYLERGIKITKDVGNKLHTAVSFHTLGTCFELQRSFPKALDSFDSSVRMFNIVRRDLKNRDEWKVSYRDMYETAYTSLWRLLLKQGMVDEALFACNQGRAQALNDLMELNYGIETTSCQFHFREDSRYHSFSFLPSITVFIAIDKQDIVFWVIQDRKEVELRKEKLSDNSSMSSKDFLKSLIVTASQEIDVKTVVRCEDRSLDKLGDELVVNGRSPQTPIKPVPHQMNALRTFYDIIINPVEDLLHGGELILVPEGPLCLAPFAAFVDSNSRYLSDVCRIRVIPSLTSLKLIADSPDGYHSKTGVLLVGDPWVQEVVIRGKILEQLPCARREVQMIGRMFNTKPLIGKEASKSEVLRRLSSVTLIHIAAHGRMETGEIALAPNTTRASQIPANDDFLLTMKDITSVKIRARLVVLSCCHSGRGEIKAEGVVGIARAFLGAGARAVLVSLWAIDDDATLQFMKSFYSHLVKGISASESLNRAMKHMRESDEFNEVKHWAPFVLIGDDVTLELGGSE